MIGKLLVAILLLHQAWSQAVQEEELSGKTKYLNMTGRGLKDIPNLSTFAHLEVADFSHNAIGQLDWERLAGAPHLRSLNLSGNLELSLPESGSLADLPLSVLNMSDCNVGVITQNALSGLTNLEVLDLRGNPIALEKSPAFEELAAPPKLLIVSKASRRELSYICRRADMQVRIVDDGMLFDCKDVRRDDTAEISRSPNRETLAREIMVDELIIHDTHMELAMGDQPMEDGSHDVNETKVEDTADQGESANNGTETGELKPEVSSAAQTRPDDSHNASKPEEDASERTDGPILKFEHAHNTDKTNVTEDATDPEGSDEESTDEQLPKTDDSISENTAGENKDAGAEGTDDEEPITAQVIEPELIHVHEDDDDHDHQRHYNLEHQAEVIKEVETIQAKQPVHMPTTAKTSPVDIPPFYEDEVPTGETKSADSSSTGKNLILLLVIAAVVMGSAFGMMKVYKDRRRSANEEDQTYGKEMVELSAERKPLMGSDEPELAHVDGDKSKSNFQTGAAVPPPADADMTAKDILNNVGKSGLPDIDDPNRLSTIIVSSTSLNETSQ